jgi:hypothetical protein
MAWSSIGSIRGPEGPQGPQGDPGADGSDGAQGPKGDTGDAGARGAKWFTGTGPPGSVSGSQAGDMYIDTATGDLYELA